MEPDKKDELLDQALEQSIDTVTAVNDGRLKTLAAMGVQIQAGELYAAVMLEALVRALEVAHPDTLAGIGEECTREYQRRLSNAIDEVEGLIRQQQITAGVKGAGGINGPPRGAHQKGPRR